MTRQFQVVLLQVAADGSYVAEVPTLGLVGGGETREAAIADITAIIGSTLASNESPIEAVTMEVVTVGVETP